MPRGARRNKKGLAGFRRGLQELVCGDDVLSRAESDRPAVAGRVMVPVVVPRAEHRR